MRRAPCRCLIRTGTSAAPSSTATRRRSDRPSNCCFTRYRRTMGLVTSKLLLRNPRLPELGAVEVDALADSGALFLCIPESLRAHLRLESAGDQRVVLADGSVRTVPYVGPIEVRFKNRVGFTGALVIGDQVLVGAIPMEEMDLVIIPRTRTLDVNPASPDIATTIVKQIGATYAADLEVTE